MKNKTCQFKKSINLNCKEFRYISKVRKILNRDIKKATQCTQCGKILLLRNTPIICEACRKFEYDNSKSIYAITSVFFNLSHININEYDEGTRFSLKETVRGISKRKPTLPYVFESVCNISKNEKTKDHINGCLSVALETIKKIQNGEIQTIKEAKDFIWEKSSTLEVSAYDNVNGLKNLQNKGKYITPEEYISVVGRIQKEDGSYYSKEESANLIRKYFL